MPSQRQVTGLTDAPQCICNKPCRTYVTAYDHMGRILKYHAECSICGVITPKLSSISLAHTVFKRLVVVVRTDALGGSATNIIHRSEQL